MRAIYKYGLSCHSNQPADVMLPKGAQVLSVGTQGDKVYLWAAVKVPSIRSQIDLEIRRFNVYATGEPILDTDGPENFIGRVTQGPYEWHIFEVR